MIPVGVACSCLVVSYLCVYATGKGWWLVFGVSVCRARAKHTGPSYKPYCMPSLTVALLLLEWLHDGVYAGRCCCRAQHTHTHTYTHPQE